MKIKETLQWLLQSNPEGLTVPQLVELSGKTGAHIYRVMKENKGFYIADWLKKDDVGGPPALWKWSEEPQKDKPRPEPQIKTGERAQYHREYTAQWHKRRAIQTTIRGPWPAY